jgi:transposase
MPPDIRDWLPENHIARFILQLVDQFSVSCNFWINWKGSGSAQYPPSMLAALLVYCYATGRFSSRRIEEATYSDVAVRFITGDTHPDHDTICVFRRRNKKAFQKLFVDVLALAGRSGLVKQVGGISVDGSKIKANASKHAAVSYKHAGELIKQLTAEVDELTRKAEKADSTPLEDGLSIPDEINRRTDKIKKLRRAREEIAAHYEAQRQEKQAEFEQKKAERDAKIKEGMKPRGKGPQPPSKTPPDKMQYNFTDPQSHIMVAGSGKHFEQAYNAQAAVDIEGSMMVLGNRVSTSPTDKQQLSDTVDTVDERIRKVDNVLADTGFWSGEQIEKVESNGGPEAYVASRRGKHGKTVADLEIKEDPPPPPEDAPVLEKVKHRMNTKKGKQLYKLRKQTVEPVFGIIKQAMGFRQFHLRGHPKVELEWQLVCLAYNFRRLFKLASGTAVSELGLNATAKA